MVLGRFNRTWYRHTAYVSQPVKTSFPEVDLPYVCCVYKDAVTDAGTLWQTNWQNVTPPAVKIISSELVYEKAPNRCIWDIAGTAAGDVESARASGEDLAFHDALIKRIAASGAPGSSETQPEERWDVYKVEVESLWPETLYDPDRDPGMKCVVM